MSEYEFKQEENKILSVLIRNIYLSCITLIIAGGFTFLLGFFGPIDLFSIVAGFAIACIGISLFFPTDNFKAIINTQGNDIKQLLIAFSDLKKGWLIVYLVTFIWLAVSIVHLFF